MIVINGQFPGPLIRANEGDRIVVNVHNSATNSTSLHWHGQFQNGTNWMDGTTGITGCGIAPGESFRYELEIKNQRGTYWYHAHISTTRLDGLFGPLIIHSPNEGIAEKFDTDRIIMVQDYYHVHSAALLWDYLAPDNENAEPVPQNGLFNGQNTFNCSDTSLPCDSRDASPFTLSLDPTSPHRLRFINVGALGEFDIDIDDHQLTLVEVDGTAVKPHTVDRFRIHIAQRYSFILQPPKDLATRANKAFWMRARFMDHCFAEVPPNLQMENKAVVRYSDASTLPQTEGRVKAGKNSERAECEDMDLREVEPVIPIKAPEPDEFVHIRSNFMIGHYQLSRGFMNDTSWRPSKTPTLFTAIDGIQTGNASFSSSGILSHAFDSRQLVYKTDGIKTIDILINNFDDGSHPFHLHGYKFWVLAEGKGYFSHDMYRSINTTNPLRRDTATVGPYQWILVRFIADNPGIWAFHCHLAWHMESGMLMQFLTRADMLKNSTIPKELKGLCERPERQRWQSIPDKKFKEWVEKEELKSKGIIVHG